MSARVKIEGLAAFKSAMGRAVEAVDRAAEQATTTASRELAREAKARASGRPGPEVRSGDLVGSIAVDGTRRRGKRSWQAPVTVSVPYARAVEVRFPYMRPALRTQADHIHETFRRAWQGTLKG